MGGGGDTQTVQKADPWAGQQPYLTDLFSRAKQRYDSGGAQYYPGTTLSSVSPATRDALSYAEQVARGAMPNQAARVSDAQGNLLAAGDINNNPNLRAAISAATEPVIRQFTDAGGTLSQIRSQAVANGNYGGSRQGIAEGIAMDRLSQNVLGIGAQMAQSAYGQGLDAQAKGIALQPSVTQATLQPATALDAVGQQRRQLDQQFIDDEMQRWNYQQQLPDANLARYQQLINGGFGGTSTTDASGAKPNLALNAMGGAAAGYSMATMMPALGMTGPVGAGIGLMAALLLSS